MYKRKPALQTGDMEFERCGRLPGREHQIDAVELHFGLRMIQFFFFFELDSY